MSFWSNSATVLHPMSLYYRNPSGALMSAARPSPPLYMQPLESLKSLSYATSDLYLLRDTETHLISL